MHELTRSKYVLDSSMCQLYGYFESAWYVVDFQVQKYACMFIIENGPYFI